MADMAKLFEEFDEEIDGVHGYLHDARACKDDKAMSGMYMEMAKQELQHAKNIQSVILKEAEAASEEDPKKVLDAIWNTKKNEMDDKLAMASFGLAQGL